MRTATKTATTTTTTTTMRPNSNRRRDGISSSSAMLILWLLSTTSMSTAAPSSETVEAAAKQDIATTTADSEDASQSSSPLIFTCPIFNEETYDEAAATAQNDNFDGYWETYLNMNERNLRDLSQFRVRTYDYRQDPYYVMKRKTRRYKRAYFGNVVRPGDAIYESACGQGFNLYMTLEILNEEWASLQTTDGGNSKDKDEPQQQSTSNHDNSTNKLHNITIYANDYLDESVHVANTLFRAVEPQPDVFRTGAICQGDSTNLSHVPTGSMDLAYTGFIDPLLDPLNLLQGVAGVDIYQVEHMMEHLCESANGIKNDTTGEYMPETGDPLHQRLTALMQQKQEDWHSEWVVELVRIAKPGKYIIIEDVGWPGCSDQADWAGVDTEWWRTAIDQYQWDVYPESLQIVEKAWYGDRYNVRMQKKKLNNEPYTDQALDEQSRRWFEEFDGWRLGQGRRGVVEDEEEDDDEAEDWEEEDEEEWEEEEED